VCPSRTWLPHDNGGPPPSKIIRRERCTPKQFGTGTEGSGALSVLVDLLKRIAVPPLTYKVGQRRVGEAPRQIFVQFLATALLLVMTYAYTPGFC
jgi:hypothetical protein